MARHRTPSVPRWRFVSKSLPKWLIALGLALLFLFFSATVAYSAYKAHRRRPPDQVHLAWIKDPATTMTIVWRTYRDYTPSYVQYRPKGTEAWQEWVGVHRPSGTEGMLHEVTLEDLSPNTEYEYRVKGDYWSVWSDPYTFRTAPAGGASEFDVVYVADTGLVGRKDGLSTGTQQIIDEIAKLNPLLVLGGGDYAYYDGDKRYRPLDRAIDAWFNQMMPVASKAALMPTYGNHEAMLQESVDLWSQRFPTPAGFDHNLNYSFDVGNVHFISLFTIFEEQGVSNGTLKWLEEDIQAAQAAGKRWIIPFTHVSAFAEGKSHPSNLALRAQLGPLLEKYGVKLIVSSHDQAYERTYPLVNVPQSITATSTSKSCYTLEDGLTWLKSSPGGKESNKSGSFSIFQSDTAPPWTAYRNNTMHVFTQLHFTPDQRLQVKTYGLKGDGKPPVVLDAFEYTTGRCGA
ncbi:metallophosphoesterase family protein [Thermoleptolyngbya sichuanensis XZ-Cy5]|uniref:purple acid phosphatase family protein n=1 Tax=Thermoleptolyngbya sichuanensis TaxID=2885951 RepID=UPI00240D23DC|nr:metallophosphoesterase family protein [Thermoleptolyngbya sichuanensis]MDG2617589.1 metallophosphoesterase family protein [Thermoleptolyngbya sichuanensis XZ-Cy5]